HRRMAELVEALVQTDELRVGRPEPLDEARNVTYYLEQLFNGTLAGAVEEFRDVLLEAGVPEEDLQVRSPIRLGNWVGGDRDGNPGVTAKVTRDVLGLHNERVLRLMRDELRELAFELSQSSRIVTISDELRQSLEREREL